MNLLKKYDQRHSLSLITSRMESNSETGKINISENTYTLIKDKFECEYRGELEVKNKGMMKMYFVNSKEIKTI